MRPLNPGLATVDEEDEEGDLLQPGTHYSTGNFYGTTINASDKSIHS